MVHAAPEIAGGAAPRPLQARFDELMLLLGRLNYTWTNTESLLIHLIAGLARVEKDTAVVIFLTLNATRGRLDLVERLAKAERVPVEERARVLSVTGALGRLSGLRNRFNHCIYSVDTDSGGMQSILMRISDRKDGIRMGQVTDLGEAGLVKIRAATEELSALNNEIWALVFDFDYPR
ncbi:hypothetical protein [Frigidibacter sp. ROC022]|uniref:hypothetical protein n=1 Tax=Frigidibacter sp. ROC022 TaxID=2971796 RepID=UPI00215A1630|nr:hypothetical protein [Frigidibacter sp. ROC022]MCR8725870.1 hypothetical protein [Frigidibacter sp. ROC022]